MNLTYVSAIIVTFHPDKAILADLFNAIYLQVSCIIVVDNGSSESTIEFIQQAIPDNGVLIEKGFNSGIAEALNSGIERACELGANYVVLFDQDSIPAPNMVETLLVAINKKPTIAAVGPRYSDIKGQYISPFVILDGFRLRRKKCGDNDNIAVDHLISSGCMISMKVLADIGGMEEKLFIDYVDTEWCLRAKHKGYTLFGVGSALMQHDLGDDVAYLFGRSVPIHSPKRQYYLIRNGLWLLRQPWVSNRWRVMDVRRLFLIYLVYSFFVGKRFQNWKMMSLGIWHGLRGRMGQF